MGEQIESALTVNHSHLKDCERLTETGQKKSFRDNSNDNVQCQTCMVMQWKSQWVDMAR